MRFEGVIGYWCNVAAEISAALAPEWEHRFMFMHVLKVIMDCRSSRNKMVSAGVATCWLAEIHSGPGTTGTLMLQRDAIGW